MFQIQNFSHEPSFTPHKNMYKKRQEDLQDLGDIPQANIYNFFDYPGNFIT